MLQERLLEGRMFFSCSKGYPIMVSSVIHYKPQEEEARRVRQKWIDERGAEAFLIPKRWNNLKIHIYIFVQSGLGIFKSVGDMFGTRYTIARVCGDGGGVGGDENAGGELIHFACGSKRCCKGWV